MHTMQLGVHDCVLRNMFTMLFFSEYAKQTFDRGPFDEQIGFSGDITIRVLMDTVTNGNA